MMEDEVASFVTWSMAIQGGGGLLCVVSLGGSEVARASRPGCEDRVSEPGPRDPRGPLTAMVLRLAPMARAVCEVKTVSAIVQPLVTASARIARVRAVGMADEKAAGTSPRTPAASPAAKAGRYRIPDQLDDAARVIGEVKKVKHQGLTSQLTDFLADKQTNPGWSFVLYSRAGAGTTLSGPLRGLVDSGEIILRRVL